MAVVSLRTLLPLALLGASLGCEDDGLMSVPTPDAGTVFRCEEDTDCPDGEVCTAGACVSLDQCGPDMPCPDPAQICELGPRGFNICVFTRCEDDSECADLECDADLVPACIAGGCICDTPCMGGCPFGQGCCIPTDTCQDLPPECMGLTCPPGEFVSVTSSGAWNTMACEFQGETCQCERLPPLPEGDIGLYSALAHDGRSFVMSAYNLTYGDLMFGLVNAAGEVAWEFVDGVPTTTTADDITGDVQGPRRGLGTPGPDVGIYTDVAIAPDGTPHIVYQDRDNGALKHARLSPSGWQTHTIEGEGVGDTGRYASLAIDDQGRPVVAYLSLKEEGPRARQSVLRLAVARVPAPAGPNDWGLRDLEVRSLAGTPCAERCNVDEVCVRNGDVCVVPDPDSACSPRCGSGEACVAGACARTRSLPAFMDLPRAPGLWPSLALVPGGGALIAFHDRLQTNLRIGRIQGADLLQGTWMAQTLEGRGAPNGGDDETGLFPTLFVQGADEIHLAYVNATRQTLRYRLLSANLVSVLVEDVEVGLGAGSGPDGELVGADAALVVDANGQVRIAYQNATLGDLRYARRTGADQWSTVTLAGDEMPYAGSFGFYCDQALDASGRASRISTYRYFLSASGGADNGVSVFDAP